MISTRAARTTHAFIIFYIYLSYSVKQRRVRTKLANMAFFWRTRRLNFTFLFKFLIGSRYFNARFILGTTLKQFFSVTNNA